MSAASGPRPVVGEGATRSLGLGLLVFAVRREPGPGAGIVVIVAVPVGVGANGVGGGGAANCNMDAEPFCSRLFCNAGLYCRRRVRALRKTCCTGFK